MKHLIQKMKITSFTDDKSEIKQLSYNSSVLKALCLTRDETIIDSCHNSPAAHFSKSKILQYWNFLMGSPYHPFHSDRNFKFDDRFLNEALHNDSSELAGFLYKAYPYLTEEQRVFLRLKWGDKCEGK